MTPERPEEHVTNTKAQAIYTEAIAGWTATNPHHAEDYGIDYTSEVFSLTRNATGIDFQTQLKGTLHPDYRSDVIAHEFSSDRIAHFLDNKRLPVFFVLVDITRRVGFFIFMQEYARTQLKPGWRSQGKVTLYLPLKNSICDQDYFSSCVREADRKMASYRPGAVIPSLEAEERRLNSLDPRLDARLVATTNGIQVNLSAKEAFSFSLAVNGPPPDVASFLHRLINRGELVSPKEFGVTVTPIGLPIVEQDPGLLSKLHVYRKNSGSLQLSTNVVGGQNSMIELAGEWTAGLTHGTLVASLGATITLSITIGQPNEARCPAEMRVACDFSSWVGRSVSDMLPDYDRLRSVFLPCDDDYSLVVTVLLEGNFLARHSFSVDQHEWIKQARALVWMIDRLRYISSELRIPFRVVDSLTLQDYRDIDRCYRFLKGERVSLPISSATIDTVSNPGEQPTDAGNGSKVALRLPMSHFCCDLFGTSLDCGSAECEITAAEMSLLSEGYSDGVCLRKWAVKPTADSFVSRRPPASTGGIDVISPS